MPDCIVYKDHCLTKKERLSIGLDFLFSSKSAGEIQEQYSVSRSYAYKLQKKAAAFLDDIEPGKADCPTIAIDEKCIQKTVISLALDCHSSYEGIMCFFENIYGIHISYGKISDILQSKSIIADDINRSISLESVRYTANDEIFQGDVPILTSIDLESTYIINLQTSKDRKADTWESLMAKRKQQQGLNPKVSISDAGPGLLCGIPKALPDIEQRFDLFHLEKDLGGEISKLVRKAEAMIRDEEKMMKAVSGSKPHKSTQEKLYELWEHIDSDLQIVETITILYAWLKELLSFCGYSVEEVLDTAHWICSQMLELQPDNKSFRKQVHVFEERLDKAVNFLRFLTGRMSDAEDENGLEPGTLQCLYRLRTYAFGSDYRDSWNTVCDCVFSAPEERKRAEEILSDLIRHTYRASSMIENVNGRIRVFIDAKRSLPPLFDALLMLYLNTKPYRRSEKEERVGHSPMEMLIGKPHDSFYTMLGL